VTRRVRFLRADLAYGCHFPAAFEIPERDAPIIVAGPNGSGKSTLVEALVRTLFGFDRRQPLERDRLSSRVPWAGERCRASVEIGGADGRRWRITRTFEDDRVEIAALDGDETWAGDGNPAAVNQEAVEYRRRLGALFGLSEMDHYESTACIAQGRLLDTRLREELLQIETGGYGNVDEALVRVSDEHRRLTTRQIDGTGQSRRKPGRVEALDAEITRLKTRLRSAEAVLTWRAPLEQEVDELRASARELDGEIGRLEQALGPLNGRRALESRIETCLVRQAAIEKARQRLERVARQLREVEEAVAIPLEERYPPDFLERVGRIEWMWGRQSVLRSNRDRLKEEGGEAGVPRPWIAPVVATAMAATGAVTALILGSIVPAVVGAAFALVVGSALVIHRAGAGRRKDVSLQQKRAVYEELDRLAEELSRELEGVPRAKTLSPASLDERRHAFEAQRQAAEKVGAARAALEEELRDAARTLTDEPATAGGASANLADAAAELLSRCAAAAEAVRTDIARARIEIDALGECRLPAGVDPVPEAVESALAERRAARRGVEAKARAAETRLLQEGTGHESPVALRDEIDALEADRAEVDREARVYECAHALIRDAYREFREHDQERLLGAVSRSLRDLTGGAIGPIEAPGSLADAGVRLHGRPVPLASPPLSYGEFHAALLAVRLGASDFHARSGIRPPMIVDEPFAYLDLDRARELWRLLREAARERQVIVLTQEALTLEALGVAPDIELSAALSRSAGPADTSPSVPGP
jgi:energy-coupling factor transporter ATP-binding protein EcfA2